MTDLAVAGTVYAEAYCGAWIARCGRPWCANALMVQRGQQAFTCEGGHSCGWTGDIMWPADPDAIEAILEMRPVPTTRNWVPSESIEDLLAENAEHGCIPPAWTELAASAPGGALALCDVVDGRVVGGLLHQQLEAAGRREIGA